MESNKRKFSEKLKYSFDNFMSKGGLSIFMALMALFVGAIVVVSLLRFLANLIAPQENMNSVFDQWWLSFLQIADGGSIAEDTDSNFINRIVGIIALFLGMVLFSSLVAFITSLFEAKLDELRKGKSDVVEKNHTLILGFGDRVLEIIRELIVANESERSPAIVVLAENEKDEMDDFFRERIEDFKTTRIITRSGSTSSIQLLKRVGVDKAKSIVILNGSSVTSSDEEKKLSDARVLKTIMAVMTCTGENNFPPMTVELHLENMRDLAKNISENISIIDEHVILAKLMVQTSRISGLAQVYDNLVGFDGCEFYFHKPEANISGKKYKDLIFHYATSSVLGLRKSDKKILLNPTPDTLCENGDEIILIAEDDSTIKYLDKKIEIKAPSISNKPPLSKHIENQLIIGWSRKAPTIIDEYCKYLIEGSNIIVICENITEEIKIAFEEIQRRRSEIKLKIIDMDIHNFENIEKIKPEQFDNIILLAGDGGDAELRDSETVSSLLEFRRYFKKLNKKNLKTQLITEVADSENIEIIQNAGVKDFLISNQFVSKIYAQCSEEPDVLKIYDDLFSPEGSEVYIKPADLFLSDLPAQTTFGELCSIALLRNETCFGVKIKKYEDDRDANYGIYINPDKNQKFEITKDDALITLAEDET